ncbi:extracellular solute-binding protein family 1 [Beutenbergia cavernae DSM 12333]|uniref:Extracellular solute-binding protein family 1 n=1 Tax=Beutenbergia cavernae (strain ATCC BAA-8 / DSM 12333 / CCUG 43141 / JCM 11478 / NBRC 16432 / NCIMB 13614 / HKI 0122) TaxID=471853 RepID=C5C3Z8_BEUC1|nr:sugar ABC transporter substrate-binding protein [Beutenbergia cavernae]ACQ79911.1 extracellular solute-binding protein family 1 [Beutenbergia cavernae DSM 12333]
MRRRTFLGAAALAPLGAAVAACSDPPDGGERPAGRARISYGMWDQLQVPAMQEVIDAFNVEHPDIEVTIQLTPFSTYWTRLQTSITGGGAADVFWMNGPSIRKFAHYGTLLPLGERLAADGVDLAADHPANLVDLYAYDGEQYGVPKDYDCISLYYNKALFDEMGVPYPDATWTWDTVRDAVAEFRDPARGRYGISSAIDRQRNLYPLVFQNGGEVIDGGRSGFDSEATIGGLEFWTDLVNDGLAPNAMATADTQGRSLFLGGQIAMYYGLPNDAVEAYDDPAIRERTDIAVLPAGTERGNVIHGLANVVNARTAFPDAAYELVKFMAGREAGEIQGASGSILPSFAGTEAAYLASKPEFNLQAFIDQIPDCTAYPVSMNTNTWENMQYTYLAPAWIGDPSRSVADASRRLATEMNRVLDAEPAT